MKRRRHAKIQIIAILKEKTADLCRKQGIAKRASTTGRPNMAGGLEVSEAKRLKGLESENAKLRKLLADAMFDNAALKGSGKKCTGHY